MDDNKNNNNYCCAVNKKKKLQKNLNTGHWGHLRTLRLENIWSDKKITLERERIRRVRGKKNMMSDEYVWMNEWKKGRKNQMIAR